MPFFLVSFFDPDTREPLSVDPRGVLKKATDIAKARDRECISGVEYEVCDVWELMRAIKLIVRPFSILISRKLQRASQKRNSWICSRSHLGVRSAITHYSTTSEAYLTKIGSAWVLPVAYATE